MPQNLKTSDLEDIEAEKYVTSFWDIFFDVAYITQNHATSIEFTSSQPILLTHLYHLIHMLISCVSLFL
jgi:hypothetical protein